MAKKKAKKRPASSLPPLATTPKLLSRKITATSAASPSPSIQNTALVLMKSALAPLVTDRVLDAATVGSIGDFPPLPSRVSFSAAAFIADPDPHGTPEAFKTSNEDSLMLLSRNPSPVLAIGLPGEGSVPGSAAGNPAGRLPPTPTDCRSTDGLAPTPQDQHLGPIPHPREKVVGTPHMAETNNISNPSRFSWSELVQGPKKKMVKKGSSFLLDSGEVCVKIPNNVIKSNQHRWEELIITQFSGNSPPPGTLHAIVNGIWSPKVRNIFVSRLTPRACLLKIPCSQTRKRVIAQGMWHIEKQAMFVAKWEPGLQPKIPELTSAPVWLEFHNVPPHFFSEEGLEHIAGLVGEPLYLHHSTANMLNLEVAKVFTVIDPTQTLPEAVNVQFESGHIHRIGVSCPWLPPTCSFCKQIGHSIKRCPTAPITCQTCASSAHSSEVCLRSKKKMQKEANEEPKGNQKVNPQTHKQVANRASKDSLTDASAQLVTIDLTAADSSGKMEIDIGLNSVPRLKTPHIPYSGLPAKDTPVLSKLDNGKKLMLNVSDSIPSNSDSSFDSGASDFSSELEEDLPITGLFKDVLSRRSRKLLRKRMSRSSGSKQLS